MPVITTGFNNNYYSGQGELFLAKLDVSGGIPKGFYFVGNCPRLEVQPAITRRKHKESTSGNRLVDKTQTTEKGGRVLFTLEDIQKKNLALALGGANVQIPGASISGANFDTFASGLIVGDIVKTKFQNLTSIVLKDSAGSPATLVLDTDYSVLDAARGIIKILSLGAYVQPFRAQYTYATTDVVTAFEAADDQEYYLYFAGANTEANPDQKLDVEIYRVVFDPSKGLSLINDEQGSFEIEGEILKHATKAADPNYGGFLREVYVTANA